MTIAMTLPAGGSYTPHKNLELTGAIKTALLALKPKVTNPQPISMKAIYADVIRGAFENYDLLATNELYQQIIATYDAMGYENLTVYHGLVLRKPADLILLSNLEGEDRITVYGHSLPRHVVIYGAFMAAALQQSAKNIFNRHLLVVTRNYMGSIASNLALSALQ